MWYVEAETSSGWFNAPRVIIQSLSVMSHGKSKQVFLCNSKTSESQAFHFFLDHEVVFLVNPANHFKIEINLFEMES